ncbi:MAG: hypothetical protein SF051_14045 [Elusimicrobiota bacterium]|nr:hypothetical protein [Elusimicrobiota bacterium]
MKTTALVALLALAAPAGAGPLDRCRDAIPEGAAYDFLRVASASAPEADREERAERLLAGLSGACAELDPNGSNAEFLGGRAEPRMPDLRRGTPEQWRAYSEDALRQLGLGALDAGARVFVPLAASVALAADVLARQGDADGFVEALDALRLVSDPHLRARRVYEMVSRRQGAYDDGAATLPGSIARPYPLPPSTVRERAVMEDASGVCRDFALLLFWALQRTERPADRSLGREARYEVALVSRFSRNSAVPLESSGHMWVRIAFPRAGGEHDYADLDTTWHEHYAPLALRFSRLSDEQRAGQLSACRALQTCATQVYRPLTSWRKAPPARGPGRFMRHYP